ncbi:MAG: polysaccharide biosynthesis protein PslG [Solirubrobacterales bacterium]|jgi:hypothetical protein|nr:polysaccharide biosynthesis protein PslG [Solirubrobacterales bacterium]
MRGAKRTSTLSLLAVAVTVLAAQGASAAQQPIFGFNDTAQTFAAQADAAKRAGATMARIPVSWEMTEPQPGKYDWSLLDSAVTALRARQIRPLFVISAAPSWAAPQCDRHVTQTCAVGEGFEGAYAGMGLALLQRFRGSQVQAWNEPNLDGFGAIDPQRLAELTNALYQVAPRKVIGPAASPGYSDYLHYTALAYAQINRHVPMAVNLYPRSVFRADKLQRDWRRARRIAGRRALWVTEIGFSAFEFGEGGQARKASSAYRFLARHGARAVIFHCLQDPANTDNNWLGTLGMLTAEGNRKPVYSAVRRVVATDSGG